MFDHRSKRAALLSALFAVAASGLGACGGGAAVGSSPISSSPGSGSGSGSGGSGSGGSGAGGATATPTAGATSPGGGSSSAAPSATPTSAGGASAAPTVLPSAAPTSATTPNSLDSISILPAVVDGDLGGIAQIGIIDPNYSGPYSVSIGGAGLLGNLLGTISNVTNGTLQGSPAGTTTLTLNLANALQLGLLGPNGNVVTVCEQQNPTTCKSVDIANNGVVPMVGATVDSIVLGPMAFQTFGLIAPALDLTNFMVVSTPQGISVTNLGNGQFEASAAANVAVPLTGNITLSDGMGHTITIPISVP